MVGRHWETAEGTIVATQVAVQTAAGYVNRLEYAVDVQPASGTVVRVTLREPKFIKGGFSQPAVGDVVAVLYDPKSGDAKFDTSDPRLKISVREQTKQAAFEAVASASPSTAATGGPGQVRVLTGSEAAPIVNALLSTDALTELNGLKGSPVAGDPAARLKNLDDLKAKGLVSDAEYAAKRQEIIDAV
jgi:hypothetical protein